MKSFTLKELTHATNKFDISTKVGEGGYGNVYMGILSDETVVAIKRAGENSLQGQKEFLTEIELLSRLHHRNLVSLIGYCNEEEEQVYNLKLSLSYVYHIATNFIEEVKRKCEKICSTMYNC